MAHRRDRLARERRVLYVVVTAVLILLMLPFLWLLQMSFKTNAQVFTFPPPIFFRPTFENYAALWDSGFRTSFANSLTVGVVSTVTVP